ncbi:DUF5979 domain-containing protein [Cellulomonas soli]|uniref:DUF5979 domain-containing protein n=1 Tax=Cellulomonas soli TaxID=931535 RepID=UPI003F87BADB
MTATLASLAVVATSVLAGAAPALAAPGDPGWSDMHLTKTVSTSTVDAGETFSFLLTFDCYSNVNSCQDAVLTDTLPAGLTLISVDPLSASIPATVATSGNTVTVAFTKELGDPHPAGSVGLVEGSTGSLRVHARFLDRDASDGDLTVTNTATMTASNRGTVTSSADVTLSVVPAPLATAGKTWADAVDGPGPAPVDELVQPGAAKRVTLTGTTSSNFTATSLTLREPSDPTSIPAGSAFDRLDLAALTGADVAWPAGSTGLRVVAYVGGTAYDLGESARASVSAGDDLLGSLPVDVADVTGLELTFLGAMGTGATGGVTLGTVQRTSARSGGPVEGTVTNTVAVVSEGQVDGTVYTSPAATASASFELVPAHLAATSAKSTFSPATLPLAGATSTVTISGTNTSNVPAAALTLSDPAPGSSGVFAADGIQLAGLGTDGAGAGIQWPSGATSATLTVTTAGGTSSASTTTAGTLPTLAALGLGAWTEVTGLQVEFAGAIAVGAVARVPYQVAAGPTAHVTDGSHAAPVNCVAATTTAAGTTSAPSTPACSTVTLVAPTLAVSAAKRLTSSTISTAPGTTTTAVLGATARVGGASGANARPTTLVMTEQRVDGDATSEAWWDTFEPTSLVATPVASGDTLTVQVHVSGAWQTVRTLAGPATLTQSIASAMSAAAVNGTVTGVRMLVERPTGFADGATVRANLTFAVRAGSSYAAGQTLTNCTQATAELAGNPSSSATSAAECDDVTGLASGPGGPAPLTKDADRLVTEGASGAAGQLTLGIGWSTNGADDLARVEVSDFADPATGDGVDGTDSFFDAFDLVGLPRITAGPTATAGSAWDPYLVFDQVVGVELWDGTTWRALANTPCTVAAPCTAGFPGVTLTAQDRADAWAVRLVYVPLPTAERAAVVDALVAAGDWRAALTPTGSGVAAVPAGDTARGLALQVRLRDVLRSDPALPVNDARTYNACAVGASTAPPLDDCVGQVVNDGLVRGGSGAGSMSPLGAGTAGNAASGRTVTILPMALAVTATKSWLRADAYGQSPHDLALPEAGTPDADFPRATLHVTATNATADSAVDTLTITEPSSLGAAGTNPFDRFTITSLSTVPPTGADASRTVVRLDTGSGLADVAWSTLSTTQRTTLLADAVQVQVEFAGRIAPSATGALTLDTRLRPTVRGTGDPVTATAAGAPVTNEVTATSTDGRVCEDSTATGARMEDVDPCVPQPVTDTATDHVTISAPSLDVLVTKDISRASVDRDVAGTQPFDVRLTIQNVGNSEASALTLTDAATMPGADADTGSQPAEHASPAFYDAVDLTGATVTQLPTGTTRIRLDVLTGATFTATGSDLAVTGGTWTTGTPVAATTGALALPAGAAWSDVTGVRVVFLGDALATPGQVGRVTLAAVLRDTLRSGGAPSATGGTPSTMDDTVANPGASVVGEVADTVTGRADGGGLPSSVRTGSDTLNVRAGTIAVQVSKSPTGDVLPGSTVTFTLGATHTGTADLPDPVLVDVLPTDASGEVLRLDTTETGLVAGTGGAPWSVALDGAGEDLLGTPQSLRYNDSAVPATIDGVLVPAHAVLLRWEPGAVLLPGQTVRLTLPLVVRSSALGPATNTVAFGSASSTRTVQDPTCTSTGTGTRSYSASDATCRLGVPLTVSSSGAFTSRKDVRAWPTDLGATDTRAGHSAASCAADAEGYVAYPCAANVQPGGLMRWRTAVTSGNVPGSSLVLVDVLPARGDVGEVTALPRDTAWRPTWDGTTPVLDVAPAGATMTVLYTTVAQPPVTYPTGPDATWSATPPADPAAVTGFAYVLDFSGTADGTLPAGSSVRVAWTMRAPYDLHADDWEGLVAWNTFGYRGVSDATYTSQPRKAGVLFPEGAVGVRKAVQDDTDFSVAASSVDVQVTCTVPTDPTDPAGPRTTVTLPGGGAVTLGAAGGWTGQVEHVPAGASCVVTEPDAAGASRTTFDPVGSTDGQSATVEVLAGESAADNLVTVTNVYEAASLTVRKAAAGATGALADADFSVELTCTFGGQTLPLAAGDASFTLKDGASRTVTGLPVGAQCRVTETDASGATIGYRIDGVVQSGHGDLTLTTADALVVVENAFSELELTKDASDDDVQGSDTIDYTLGVRNTGPAATADVRLVDPVPAELDVTGVTAPAPWTCTVDPTDPADPAAGDTVRCAYPTGSTLVPGASAPLVTVHVRVPDDVAVDQVVNTATVRWTDTGSPDPTPTERSDTDDAPVVVRWVDATAGSVCRADGTWLDYAIDVRNVDTSRQPVTLTWFADADQDGVPDGPAVHVDTIPAGGALTGALLWPGAAVDPAGVGVAWPGWRQARAGETPVWQDQVPDASLPEAALRDGALLTVTAGPSTTLAVPFPALTMACAAPRAPELTVDKVASTSVARPGAPVDWTLTVSNTGHGATDRITLRDDVPATLRVVSVQPAAPATDGSAAWTCTVTGRTAEGRGGLVECVLGGWLGARGTAPAVVVSTVVESTGTVENVGEVAWADPDGSARSMRSSTGSAEVVVAVLALTGAERLALLVALAVGLVLAGLTSLVVRRRSRA